MFTPGTHRTLSDVKRWSKLAEIWVIWFDCRTLGKNWSQHCIAAHNKTGNGSLTGTEVKISFGMIHQEGLIFDCSWDPCSMYACIKGKKYWVWNCLENVLTGAEVMPILGTTFVGCLLSDLSQGLCGARRNLNILQERRTTLKHDDTYRFWREVKLQNTFSGRSWIWLEPRMLYIRRVNLTLLKFLKYILGKGMMLTGSEGISSSETLWMALARCCWSQGSWHNHMS